MSKEQFGELLRQERVNRKWTATKLGALVGLSRQTITSYEKGTRKPSGDSIIKISNKFKISPKPFFEALGAKYDDTDLPVINKIESPMAIPVYVDFPFHAGEDTQPVEYIYRAAPKPAPKTVEGYIVHGDCLSPVIEDGNIIIVDRERQIDNGDIVACLIDDHLHIAKLRKVADELWLENKHAKARFQDCQAVAPVIEVIKRLK